MRSGRQEGDTTFGTVEESGDNDVIMAMDVRLEENCEQELAEA